MRPNNYSFCLHKEGPLSLIKIVSRTFSWKSKCDLLNTEYILRLVWYTLPIINKILGDCKLTLNHNSLPPRLSFSCCAQYFIFSIELWWKRSKTLSVVFFFFILPLLILLVVTFSYFLLNLLFYFKYMFSQHSLNFVQSIKSKMKFGGKSQMLWEYMEVMTQES